MRQLTSHNSRNEWFCKRIEVVRETAGRTPAHRTRRSRKQGQLDPHV